MPERTRRRREGEHALRAKLKNLLALSLATPLATFAACRGAGEGATSLPDATAPGTTDAGSDAPAADGADAGDANACAPVLADAALFGEDGSCDKFVYLPCGVPPALAGVRCNPSVDLCTSVCPQGFFFVCDFPAPTCVDAAVNPAAPVYIDCTSCIGTNAGRRPVGMLPPDEGYAGPEGTIGRYFARMAHAEAASVEAFVQLHARLTELGAPPRLRRAALRAARDERVHARLTRRLARLHGAEPAPVRPCPQARIAFEDLAVENAVEGCVHETFAALVAMHQAARAPDVKVASVMRRVSIDEARHAELAWAIHRWAMRRLPADGRLRVRAAQLRALVELRRRAGDGAPGVRGVAGLPAAGVERRLVEDFSRALFGIGAAGSLPCTGSEAGQRAAA